MAQLFENRLSDGHNFTGREVADTDKIDTCNQQADGAVGHWREEHSTAHDIIDRQPTFRSPRNRETEAGSGDSESLLLYSDDPLFILFKISHKYRIGYQIDNTGIVTVAVTPLTESITLQRESLNDMLSLGMTSVSSDITLTVILRCYLELVHGHRCGGQASKSVNLAPAPQVATRGGNSTCKAIIKGRRMQHRAYRVDVETWIVLQPQCHNPRCGRRSHRYPQCGSHDHSLGRQ